ncbi:V0 domain of vacuolar H+ATPase [Suhomyces tanzawaensis NRRL Y-17324]|uniref:V-type proton ATPase subunit a n=1 Tax=Suhomyces tanzawaensis NRRL Y-17324 TaxID=984487 RepID=A0A1E4SC28_9ASCO|nr:V0 domain of vacuolar H+ATPase [Suhomyces tanzawaensis NRRL Y-17324]ODV77016.1 V0 domain of vacuolar H+ATPase [Suhomyces tanzawaensis NRRL Y-17324]
MSLVQLYVPTEVSRDIIYKVGELNSVQFRDLNSKVSDFQRAFVKELRQLDNVERQYNFFKQELDERDIPVQTYPFEPQSVVPQSVIDEHVEDAQLLEDRVSELIESTQSLYERQTDLEQTKATIQGVDHFFALHSGPQTSSASEEDALLSQLESQGAVSDARGSSFISGVIGRDKVNTLQQILWRALRGNLYFHSEELADPVYDAQSKSKVNKNSFIIFSHGSIINERIRKICESLDADLYKVDVTQELRSEQLKEVKSKLADLSNISERSETALTSELIAISKDLAKWWEVIAREKAVYQTMNRCDYDGSRQTLIAEGWIATDEIDELTAAIKGASTSQSIPTIVNILETTRTPPTYHRTNKFTGAFQAICDAYGIASYREVNPGLPTIITFPFMFAIMFGDLGHGFLLSLAALFLVLNEKKLGAMKRDEIFDMAYTGRYILLLMGVFSMYTGLLYNDIFSKSMTLFTSGWVWPEHFKAGDSVRAKAVGTYVFGLDSAWHGAENALLFSNSYKMKLSILMGYVHMTYSYFFSLVNYVHFESVVDIVGNFIPGLIFMQGIFGYLSLCIVYKWTIDWFGTGKQPPGLLNMLISMFLSPGTVAEPLYAGQSSVQVFLLFIALICVPWLLLLKPLYLKRQIDREAKNHEYQQLNSDELSSEENTHEDAHDDDDEEGHDDHNFGDIMIHQVIHTIEFCLNCVSHTASYLRLWALSLAHAQLSTVLWSMTIGNAFGATGISGVFMTVVLFAMWFSLTICILVIMEGTSAMLHSLRLHWVESMSKFFVGEGTPFQPFGFKDLLAETL